MKLSFSTRHIDRPSFASLCRLAADYGMDGFEIWDALDERKRHEDSVLRTEKISEGRSLLTNNDVEVSAISYPTYVDTPQADPSNPDNPDIPSDPTPSVSPVSYILPAALGVTAGVGLLLFLLGRRKKDEDKEEDKDKE